jgi:hypothetical protein
VRKKASVGADEDWIAAKRLSVAVVLDGLIFSFG